MMDGQQQMLKLYVHNLAITYKVNYILNYCTINHKQLHGNESCICFGLIYKSLI